MRGGEYLQGPHHHALWTDDVLRGLVADGSRGDRAVAQLARMQHGNVTRRQLLAVGLSPREIRCRVERGQLHPMHRGVYRVGHTAPAPYAREMAAVLACGMRSVLSHRSAAYVLALLPEPRGDVHITGPELSGRPGIRHHRSAITVADVRPCRGIPITSPARTVIDLGAELDPPQHENLVAEAIRRRLAGRRALSEAADRAGRRPGARQTRQMLKRHQGPALTRPGAERRFLRLVRAAGLPEPECNVPLGSRIPDFLWPAHRLIVETDGFEVHGSREAFESDRARDAERQADGFRVLRFTWRQLEERPEHVVALLARTLATPA